MKFYIREWSNNAVVLMTEGGHVLSSFTSIHEALEMCEQWYSSHHQEIKQDIMIQYKQKKSDYISIPVRA